MVLLAFNLYFDEVFYYLSVVHFISFECFEYLSVIYLIQLLFMFCVFWVL